MLEALIRKKNSGGLDKFPGDVICVKLKEAADWGSTEIRVHQVVDWEDSELESSMRDEFNSSGTPPVRITPYKVSELCEILDEEGKCIYKGSITKTRSKKYFNFLNNAQDEKTSQEMEDEFESNQQNIKREILKEKPSPPKKTTSISPEEEKLLNDYVGALKSIGIRSDIVDGKIKIIRNK